MPVNAQYSERWCEGCGIEYTPTGARQMYCPECIPNKKARHRYARYGITEGEFQYLVHRQQGKCALCSNPFDDVDHNHETGAIRGLLCRGCNLKVIGLEDKAWLEKALDYMEIKDAFSERTAT